MRKVQLIAAYLSLLNLIVPASAWNGTGHRAVAFIAYPSLTAVPPTALSKINAFRKQIGNSRTDAAVQVFQLPWLLHLIGDVHQPLHCTTRVLKTQIDRKTHLPTGDRGGNKVIVRGSGNL